MTREEARNLLNNSKPKGNNAYSIMLNESLDMAIEALEQEPKIGHWIKEKSIHGWDGHSYQCSVCGRSIHLDTEVEDLEDYPYCHCGAKMIENEEEFDNLEEMLEKLWNDTESEVQE